MRRALVILFLALLAAIPVGTGVTAQTPIALWVFAEPPEVVEWMESWERRFNAENPEIRLEISVRGDANEAREQLVAAVAGGVAPDLHFESANVLGNWVVRGIARPIDDFLATLPDLDDFFPDAMAELKFDGKTYALPYSMWTYYELYNQHLFEAAGVEFPTTWQEHVEAARLLTQVDGNGQVQVFGYSSSERVSPVWAYIKVNHALQQLGHLVVEPLGTVGRIPRDAGVAALQYRHNLMEAGTRGAPLPGWGEFNSGRLAGWQGGFNTDQTIAAIREGVAAVARRFPGPTPGTDSVMGNSGTVFMLTTTRHPQEAWRVMVAFAAPETSKEYLLVSRRFLPARRSLIDDPELRARPFAEEEIRVAYPPIFPYGSSHPLYPHFRELVGAPLQKAIEGTMAFDVSLDEAERILNLELARWAQER